MQKNTLMIEKEDYLIISEIQIKNTFYKNDIFLASFENVYYLCFIVYFNMVVLN